MIRSTSRSRWRIAAVWLALTIAATVGCKRNAPSPQEAARITAIAAITGAAPSAAVAERRDEPPIDVASAPSAAPTAAPALRAAGCDHPSLRSGRWERTYRGLTRSIAIDVPEETAGAAATPHPLLFAFHGWGGDPDQLERTTGVMRAAVARGWIVARPLGIGRSFNAGTCCGDASAQSVDDVGMVRDVIDDIAREACVDLTRVYATGFSNGGFFSHRLACELADRIAAVASVAGTLGITRCAPARPIAVLQIHGKADGTVHFGGDRDRGWSSVRAVIDTWTRADRCDLSASHESFSNAGAKCVSSGPCAGDAEVVLCRDEHAAHTWPGAPSSVGWGGSQDIDATTTVLDFFARHSLR